MPSPTIDRRAIWKRLMDRAAANQRTPTIHEPAGYEFRPEITPDIIEAMPAEAQTELALQLGRIVLDTSRVTKKRVIAPPTPIDVAKAKQGLVKMMKVGRLYSRQGPALLMAIREGHVSGASVVSPTTDPSATLAVFPSGIRVLEPGREIIAPTCHNCQMTIGETRAGHLVHGAPVCAICYEFETRECPECHSREFWHEMQRGPTTPVCRSCAERLMTVCPHCGERVARGEVRNGNCPHCVRASFMKAYSYKPRPVFFNAFDALPSPIATTWCMGVELETEIPRSIRSQGEHAYESTRGIDDLIYAKSDGSLNYGIEYVSHPFTWEWLKGGGLDRWNGFLEKLKATKHTSYDMGTCGMHVHVTKAPFIGLTLQRLLNFAHGAPNLFLQLSRRRETELVQWANPRGGNAALFESIAQGTCNSPSKYVAINVTEKTIEFRLFRGTLNPTGFAANLEAVHALLHFCKDHSLLLTAASFIAFCERNAETYPNLLGTLLRSTSKV